MRKGLCLVELVQSERVESLGVGMEHHVGNHNVW